MYKSTSPEAAGSSQADIKSFFSAIKRHGVVLHSTLMLRGDKLFCEEYCPPFTADMPHRMYSVTKSFISAAIGCLADDGKISLDDPVLKYFPEQLRPDTHRFLREQTVRDMLTMRTCFGGGDGSWFRPEVKNRVDFYFHRKPVRPAGTIFDYDSNGSYVLGVLAERVSGMPLLDFLKLRLLNEIGGFESAQILKTMDGTPWGDSAMLCTPMALLNFARLMMNGGSWNGKQLISEEYVRAATTRRTDNNVDDARKYDRYGYGYQFWMTPRGGFACLGMGEQMAICVPDKDFIFVCTGDTQLMGEPSNCALYDALFDCVVDRLDGGCPQPEDAPLALPVVCGERTSPFAAEIDGRWFALEPNPMGITRLRITLDGECGALEYENAQGFKRLPFGLCDNVKSKFPERGYSDEYGNVHDAKSDFMYDCVTSAAWVEPQRLRLRVQVLDRYLGGLVISLGWRNADELGVRMFKVAEDFFQTYDGWAGGVAE